MGVLDVYDLLCMFECWRCGDILLYGWVKGDFLFVLVSIKVEVFFMLFRIDLYFLLEDSEEEFKYLKYGQFWVIESVWGYLVGGEWVFQED